MENRRQTYRHSFEPAKRPRAELYRPGGRHTVLACEVLDVSLGGMRARLLQLLGSLDIGDSLVTRLLGRAAPSPVDLNLSIPSQVVYRELHKEEWHFGLRFLPIADTRAHEFIERKLSHFLLSEQRASRRREAG